MFVRLFSTFTKNSNKFWIYWGFIGFLSSCGDGHVQIDTDQGTRSTLLQSGGSSTQTPGQYFAERIWPIMKDTTENSKGCASSGCHGTTETTPTTFFKVHTSSATDSWPWAQVRRTSVQEGSYASSLSKLISAQKDLNHPSTSAGFGKWTTQERDMIDTWVNLTE